MSIPSVDIKNLLGQLYLLGVNSWRKNQLSTNPVFLLACKLPFRIIYSYGNWYNMEEQKDEHFPWGCSVIWRLGLLSKTISSTYSSGVLNICLVDYKFSNPEILIKIFVYHSHFFCLYRSRCFKPLLCTINEM